MYCDNKVSSIPFAVARPCLEHMHAAPVKRAQHMRRRASGRYTFRCVCTYARFAAVAASALAHARQRSAVAEQPSVFARRGPIPATRR